MTTPEESLFDPVATDAEIEALRGVGYVAVLPFHLTCYRAGIRDGIAQERRRLTRLDDLGTAL